MLLPRGITKQADSLPDSNFEKLATMHKIKTAQLGIRI